jgi:hypothetical protein
MESSSRRRRAENIRGMLVVLWFEIEAPCNLHTTYSWLKRGRTIQRPIAGKVKLVRPDPFPLFGGYVQDEQLVSVVRPHIDAKINRFEGIIVSIADESVDFDKTYFPFVSIFRQIVYGDNSGIRLEVLSGVPLSH